MLHPLVGSWLCILLGSTALLHCAEEIPSKVQAPGSMKLRYSCEAKGVLVYIWDKTSDTPKWVLEQLLSELPVDASIWKRFGEPTWEATDGSSVKTINSPDAVISEPAPNSKEDIDGLLIHVQSDSDMSGMLSGVRYIQRTLTKGGKAPATPPVKPDDRVEVPYTATYNFYVDGWSVRTWQRFFGTRDFDPGSDDGIGASARFRDPRGLAADADGNIYVADSGNHTIRKITPDGTTTTLAGMAGRTGYVDGCGGVARFSNPVAVAVDTKGTVFVTDNNGVRRISSDGVVSTFFKFKTEVPPAEIARMHGNAYIGPKNVIPGGVAVDAAGNVFVSVRFAIFKITPDGSSSIWAGDVNTPPKERTIVDGVGTAARFTSPGALMMAPDGALYVNENECGIRRVSPEGVVTTVYSDSRGKGRLLPLKGWNMRGGAIDAAGNLHFISGYSSFTSVQTRTPDGSIKPFAGHEFFSGARIGTLRNARFSGLYGICIDRAGNMYVCDVALSTIRKITPDGIVRNFAGTFCTDTTPDDLYGDGSKYSKSSYVSAIASDLAKKDVAFSLSRAMGFGPEEEIENGMTAKANYASAVFKLRFDRKQELTAGSIQQSGATDGESAAARFDGIEGLAFDANGNAYAADAGNFTIRKIDSGGVVSTLAGSPGRQGHRDGKGDGARFHSPCGIAVDKSGNVYVTERLLHTVRKITHDGTVSTLAGSPGQSGYGDGLGAAARFSTPMGIITDDTGNVYVADNTTSAIRKISPQGLVATIARKAQFTLPNGEAYTIDSYFRSVCALAWDGHGNLLIPSESTIYSLAPDGRVSTLINLSRDESVDNSGQNQASGGFCGIAVNRNFNRIFLMEKNHAVIRIARPVLPIYAIIDASRGKLKIARQLGVSNAGATEWHWEIVRRPNGSKAQLSEASTANPTFVPDIADTYIFRLTAESEEGMSRTTVLLRAE